MEWARDTYISDLRLAKNQRPGAFHRTSLHSQTSETCEEVCDHGVRLLMPLSLAFRWFPLQCASCGLSVEGERPTDCPFPFL